MCKTVQMITEITGRRNASRGGGGGLKIGGGGAKPNILPVAAGYLFHGCAIRKWAAKMSAADVFYFF